MSAAESKTPITCPPWRCARQQLESELSAARAELAEAVELMRDTVQRGVAHDAIITEAALRDFLTKHGGGR